jgi:hypothetical protein
MPEVMNLTFYHMLRTAISEPLYVSQLWPTESIENRWPYGTKRMKFLHRIWLGRFGGSEREFEP